MTILTLRCDLYVQPLTFYKEVKLTEGHEMSKQTGGEEFKEKKFCCPVFLGLNKRTEMMTKIFLMWFLMESKKNMLKQRKERKKVGRKKDFLVIISVGTANLNVSFANS